MNNKRAATDSNTEGVLESIKKLTKVEAGEAKDDERSSESVTYVFDGPFLRVEPYWFDYCSWAKGRWFNHSIIEVFRREFRDRPPAYYSHACSAGLIKVNDSRIEEGYRVKQGDRIQHRIHRHEPPVLCGPEPEILHVAEGLMVVSKPPSIPMHPSGRYRHNTLTSILMHRHPELFPTGHISCVNRLDRLVSGIVILSRSAEKADELRRAMQEMQFRKFYLARVKGDFKLARDDLVYANAAIDGSGVIECKAALLIVDHKLGLSCLAESAVHPAAKPSETRFIKLLHDPINDFSLILCEPVTGRTHQIRLHLQYLGFPIHNDPLYNNSFWNTILKDTGSVYAKEDWLARVKAMAQEMQKSPLFHQEDHLEDFYSTSNSASSSALCPDCENPHPDPDPSAMRIDLHAYKYSGPMGTFSTALPSWAGGCETKTLEEAEEAFNSLNKN